MCPIEWTKINQEENGVAWGAKDDSPGRWEVASRVCGRKLRLQHRSGAVQCSVGSQLASNFGCNNVPSVGQHVTTYLTVGKGLEYVVVPFEGDPKVTAHPSYPTWYLLSGFNSMSPYLEFDLPLTDEESYYCFEEGTEYQLWYGEDLVDWSEGNDSGTAYTDILITS